MNVKIIILRNFPNNDFYDKLSFIGMLHEEKNMGYGGILAFRMGDL